MRTAPKAVWMTAPSGRPLNVPVAFVTMVNIAPAGMLPFGCSARAASLSEMVPLEPIVCPWRYAIDLHDQDLRPAGVGPAARATGDAAGALRGAALHVMRDTRYRHPFYWAGFRVVGAIDSTHPLAPSLRLDNRE
jgi:hypothetical protein